MVWLIRLALSVWWIPVARFCLVPSLVVICLLLLGLFGLGGCFCCGVCRWIFVDFALGACFCCWLVLVLVVG